MLDKLMTGSHDLPKSMPPILQDLVTYWLGVIEKVGNIPQLNEISLMDIHKLAPRMFIGDRIVEDSGGIRYRWRYWGTQLSAFADADLSGKYLDETHNEQACATAIEHYEWSLNTGKPCYLRQNISIVDTHKGYKDYQRVIVPLANKSGQPAHILGVYVSDHENVWYNQEYTKNMDKVYLP